MILEDEYDDLMGSKPLPDQDERGTSDYRLTHNPIDPSWLKARTIEVILPGTDVEVSVAYDAMSAEPRTHDYPGSPAYIDINAVWVRQTKEEVEILSDKGYKNLEGALIDQLEWKYGGEPDVP